jgi:hypothetical protein
MVLRDGRVWRVGYRGAYGSAQYVWSPKYLSKGSAVPIQLVALNPWLSASGPT